MRITRQKKILQETLDTFETFFSVEEFYNKAQQKNSRLGIATLYRFLKSKVGQSQLHSYSCGGRTIYSLNENNHCHFHCRACGETTHLQIKKVDFLPKKFTGEVCHFQIDVHGLCERCRSKKP